MTPTAAPGRTRPGLRFGIRTLMLWVALVSTGLALARASIVLAGAWAAVMAPALAWTLHVATLRRAEGRPVRIAEGPALLVLSGCRVVLAYGWALVVFLMATMASGCLVNFVILGARCVIATWDGDLPPFLAPGHAMGAGLAPGAGVGGVALILELRRIWILEGKRRLPPPPADPGPPW